MAGSEKSEVRISRRALAPVCVTFCFVGELIRRSEPGANPDYSRENRIMPQIMANKPLTPIRPNSTRATDIHDYLRNHHRGTEGTEDLFLRSRKHENTNGMRDHGWHGYYG